MKVFFNFGSNLLILSERVLSYHMDKLVIHARTEGTQTQATTIPEGQNWPG